MKDPAVLFYFQDFLVGTEFMTDDEVGKYIRILCHQADKGVLTKSQTQRICGGVIPEAIMEKLTVDDSGNMYQERMRFEREKRMKYSESRSKNRTVKSDNICNSYDIHMENENENINVIKNSNEKNKEKDDFFIFWESYHSITGLSKTDREAAQKKWNQLTKAERQKAVDMIALYYNSLNDKKYCKKARTYLGDKNFNDELGTIEKNPLYYESINPELKPIN